MPTQRSAQSSPSFSTLSSSDVALLRFVVEHGAVPFDLLAKFAGSKVGGIRSRLRALERAGWVTSDSSVADAFPWAVATSQTGRAFGVNVASGRLKAGGLSHRRGVVEARLILGEEFPRAKWVPEATVLRRDRCFGFLPDGELVRGRQRWAIEVELTRKSVPRVREHVEGLLKRYERVIYFCSPRVLPLLANVAEGRDDNRLEVREISQPGRLSSSVKRSASKAPVRVDARIRRLLALITEEGMVAVDQLSKLIGRDLEEVRKELADLERSGLVEQGFRFHRSAGWAWTTYRGAKASGSSLRGTEVPSSGGLASRRAFMSVRIVLTGGRRRGRWVTRRMLGQGVDRGFPFEMAVLERAAERSAIVVSREVSVSSSLVARVARLRCEYDEVLWYCSGVTVAAAERQVVVKGWQDVKVRRLPDG